MGTLAALLALGAGIAAGAINAVAGGGTIVSFPVLVWLGIPPIQASATNTVALWPGYLGASAGFRREIARVPRWALWLLLPSLVGGGLGALLLLHTPERLFGALVPWLLLFATLLIAFRRGTSSARIERPGPLRFGLAVVGQLLAGIYGGYFGAGLGILLLAILARSGVGELHLATGLKNLLSLAINGVAVAWFAVTGNVHWLAAVLVAVGAIVGGWVGAALARRLSPRRLRAVVVAIGVGLAAAMLLGR